MTAPLPPRARWWQWPTVLSIDAPLVVVAWQWLFGRIAGIPLHWQHVFVVGVSVWLSYVADRWFEGWRLTPRLIRTPRHRFYHDHQLSVAVVWIAVFLCDLVIAFGRLERRELAAGAVLLVPTLLYLLSHQLIHRHRRWRVPKEIVIAVLLSAGASLFVLAAPGVSIGALLPSFAIFGLLCFTNVALIAVWEQEVDESHGQVSLARQFQGTAGLTRVLPLALSAVLTSVGRRWMNLPDTMVLCAAASALLLASVDRLEPRVGWQLARVLADLVLLTPGAVFVVSHFR